MTSTGSGNYTLSLNANKTGVYRLTARWKTNGGIGQTLYARLVSINNLGIESALSTNSSGVRLLDPNADNDGDGMSNANEDLAGTDHLNGASSLKINSIASPAAGSFSVTWWSVIGKVYRVQGSTVLGSGSWTDLSRKITATATASTWTDTAVSGTTKFYRVLLMP